jgi:hypothetical protein
MIVRRREELADLLHAEFLRELSTSDSHYLKAALAPIGCGAQVTVRRRTRFAVNGNVAVVASPRIDDTGVVRNRVTVSRRPIS